MILTEIAQVIYAPKKAFKSIIANPKYLGVIIIFILFIAVQIGYEYGQFSKTQLETTSPLPGLMQNNNNATSWIGGPNVQLSNYFGDYYNNTVYVGQLQRPANDPLAYYPLFGNFSLQVQVNNTNNVMLALTNTSNIDCTRTGFQNLSLTLKYIEPQNTPQTATLRLYSLADENFYTYDLTNTLNRASAINQWGNLTIPLGPNIEGWTESGNPQWRNITSLTLEFTYPDNTDVNMRIGALFFRGQYVTPLQYDATGFLLRFLQVFSLQFLFTWLVLSAVIYLILKVTKNPVIWKPLFVALGFTMIVMVIRGLINILATTTMPLVSYPYDASLGVVYDSFAALYYPSTIGALTNDSISTVSAIDASLKMFRGIVTGIFVVSYVWLGALAGLVINEIKPEMSTINCFIYAVISVIVSVLALWLFIGII